MAEYALEEVAEWGYQHLPVFRIIQASLITIFLLSFAAGYIWNFFPEIFTPMGIIGLLATLAGSWHIQYVASRFNYWGEEKE